MVVEWCIRSARWTVQGIVRGAGPGNSQDLAIRENFWELSIVR